MSPSALAPRDWRWTRLEEENTKLVADKIALDQSNTTLRLELAGVQVINDRVTARNNDVEDRLALCGPWAVNAKRRLLAVDDEATKLSDELAKTRDTLDNMPVPDPFFCELSEEIGKTLVYLAALKNDHAIVVGELQNCIRSVVGSKVEPEDGCPAPPAPPAQNADGTLPQEE